MLTVHEASPWKHPLSEVALSPLCIQVESETADSEFQLNNATQRLLRLEQDVTLLREKAQNTSLSAAQTESDSEDIKKVAAEVKKVGARVCVYVCE